MRKICQFILTKLGWKIETKVELPAKSVICVAPHTSNWDLPIGLMVYKSMGRKASFLIKKDWFFFPMNILFNALGGIPVNRSKRTSMTEQVADFFNKNDNFQLAVTPEGTRKANPDWKKGFYYIALAAKVPIVVTTLDYKNKLVTFEKLIVPNGDFDSQIQEIKNCYKGITPKHPDKFAM